MTTEELKLLLNDFNRNGFIILKVFNKEIILKYKKKLLKKLKISAKAKSIKSLRSLTKLEDYFSFINKDDHKKLMNRSTRTIKIDKSDAKKLINKTLNNFLGYFSDKDYNVIRSTGDKFFPKKNKSLKNYAGFRIHDAYSKDVAGYHSDHYNLGNFTFTLWIPLIGFNNKYSLNIIPGSHIYKHKKNVTTKNLNGKATLIKKIYLRKFNKPFRPNLKPGEAILLHPYLIHGNSINLGNKLRISKEIRIGT